MAKNGYYPEWLTNKECGEYYKNCLNDTYEAWYAEKDKQKKEDLQRDLLLFLTISSDVIAYRYLVKYHHALFRKLNITVEEYIQYKVDRMYATIKDKKEKIEDILAYVYMSFMLSSPRLIYDYAESLGKCKLIRENLPYFQVQRLKFFFIERENVREHYVFNVDNIDLDENTEAIRSNLDRYSLHKYNYEQSIVNADSGYDKVKDFVTKYNFKFDKSRTYILNIFSNWKSQIEDRFYKTKQELKIDRDEDFTLLDFIRYEYENNISGLNYNEYLDVLDVMNNLLKGRKDLHL